MNTSGLFTIINEDSGPRPSTLRDDCPVFTYEIKLGPGESARYKESDVLLNLRTREQCVVTVVDGANDALGVVRGWPIGPEMTMLKGDRVMRVAAIWR